MFAFQFVLVGALLLAVLGARGLAARTLGMRGVGFFGGAIQDPAAAAPWRRALVGLAGVGVSYLVPALLFVTALVGGGRVERTTEVTVLPGRPAAAAGMRSGDRVRSVAGERVATWEALAEAIRGHVGVPVEVVVARGDEEVRLTATPEGAPGQGKIGIASAGETRKAIGLGEALASGLAMPAQVTKATARSVIDIFAGKGEGEVTGPVGVVRAGVQAARSGWSDALMWVAAIVSFMWPVAAIVAVGTVPRRAR